MIFTNHPEINEMIFGNYLCNPMRQGSDQGRSTLDARPRTLDPRPSTH